MVPAWAGLCDYVPAGVPVKTPPGSGAAQTHASRVEWPQLRSNGIGVSPHGHHAAHRALWTSHLQNRSLCLHATGDSEYAEPCRAVTPSSGESWAWKSGGSPQEDPEKSLNEK